LKIDRVASTSFLGLCINGEICQKQRYFSTGHDQLCRFVRPYFSTYEFETAHHVQVYYIIMLRRQWCYSSSTDYLYH